MVALLIHLVVGRNDFPPSIWGRISTTVQISTVFLVLLAHVYPPVTPALEPAYWIAMAFTLISGFDYLFKTVHLLDEQEAAAE